MYRIAIVDDSEINLTLLSALVKKLDSCEPCLFPDAQTGLAWCSGNAPDPAIVDYMTPACAPLPDGKGPVLMITVNDDKGVRYEALEKGATDFLTKLRAARNSPTRLRGWRRKSRRRRLPCICVSRNGCSACRARPSSAIPRRARISSAWPTIPA